MLSEISLAFGAVFRQRTIGTILKASCREFHLFVRVDHHTFGTFAISDLVSEGLPRHSPSDIRSLGL